MANYTTPRLHKGKEVTHVPKGSSKLKEQAKQIWYINYTYKGKQIRVKENINRIKDYEEKEKAALILLESIKKDLEDGYDPNNELEWVAKLLKESISLDDAIKAFIDYHKKHKSRPRTIQTYTSKLNALNAFYPNILLSEINTKKLQAFIQSKIDDTTYSQNSVKSAKRTFSTFFNVCIQLEYISVNPTLGFDKKIKSHKIIDDKHIPYTDADLKVILEFMDNHDKYTAFFCRMIYFTCLRPKEIRGLKVENINLSNKTITIPADVKKVTSNDEKDFIEINESFIPFLNELELEKYPKHYYLTGSTTNIVGENRIGENTPYNKLIVVLKKLGLNNKGYDLYSFKHTSNIKKYMSGWSLAEIMKANRHSSITTTEIYLKKLGQFVDATGKLIPTI